MTKKKKGWIITGSVIGAIVVLLAVAVLVYFFGDNYDKFYARTKEEMVIPGLEDGFTPQGITNVDSENIFLFSGYMKDSSKPSRIYVYDIETKSVIKHITLSNNNAAFMGHMGGIAHFGNTVWVASEERTYRLLLSDILAAENGGVVDVIDSFKPINGSSFIFAQSNTLWVGEFYRKGNYSTDPSRHLQTPSGKTHCAFISAYTIDESKEYGITSVVPKKILSVTDLLQGFVITDSGSIVLSTSYSIPNSKIYIYNNVFNKPSADTTFNVNGTNVPVWFLDDEDMIEMIEAPCMSEELAYKDGRVYISFESAAKKYRAVVRESLSHVYSFELN